VYAKRFNVDKIQYPTNEFFKMKTTLTKLLILLSLIFPVLVLTAKAQALPILTGQYGCILNRNYAGFSTLSGSVVGQGITGTNFMFYFDFNSKTAQISVVGVNNWGTSSVKTASAAGPFGTIVVESGPLTNSFMVVVTEYTGQPPKTNTFLMMPTNNGNNLLVQSGINGTDDGQPSTGVCNKI
jgi:hypothetical protein